MPFTLSHAALAAPLARRGLVFSAVVAGSIAPDLEYFLRLNTNSLWAHTYPGALLFPLPAALLALWCFHTCLKQPLLALLPPAHRTLLEPYAGPFAFLPLRRFGHIVLSAAIGIVVHLFLDSMTHDYGIVVRHWPRLSKPLFHYGTQSFLVCDAGQVMASVGLLLVLIWQYARLFARGRSPRAIPMAEFLECRGMLPLYVTLALVALAAGAVFAGMHVPHIVDARTLRRFLGRMTVAGIDTAVLGAVLVGRYLLRGRPVAVPVARENAGDE